MASADAIGLTRRLIAVLDHDAIPAARRVSYVAKTCRLSRTTARRLLKGSVRMRTLTLSRLGMGLDVGCEWLFDGALNWPHTRTWRIHVERIKGYPVEDAARIMRLMLGVMTGHRKATNLVSLVEAGHMNHLQAARLL